VVASALAADVTTLRLVNDSIKPPYTTLFRISNVLLLAATLDSLGVTSDEVSAGTTSAAASAKQLTSFHGNVMRNWILNFLTNFYDRSLKPSTK